MSEIEFEEDSLPILDRSTLEMWSRCPRQAAFVADGGFGSAGDSAASGQEAHDAVSAGVTSFLESGGNIGTGDIRDAILDHLYSSRPDVQPDAIEGMASYAWQIASLISAHNPLNVLRYDGGKGEQSGQLAADFGDVRLTAEMDLLLATESPQVIALHDWKTGRKFWDKARVAGSFQFQFYSWLVLQNYPDIQCVEVTIHNTRTYSSSWMVEFRRRDMEQWSGRISRAIANWRQYSGKPPELTEAWPSRDACRLCDAAAVCDAPDPDISECRKDPVKYLQWTIQQQQATAVRLDHLAAIVEESGGQPIVTPDGDCYGFAPPGKSSRKPKKQIYSVSSDDSDE